MSSETYLIWLTPGIGKLCDGVGVEEDIQLAVRATSASYESTHRQGPVETPRGMSADGRLRFQGSLAKRGFPAAKAG